MDRPGNEDMRRDMVADLASFEEHVKAARAARVGEAWPSVMFALRKAEHALPAAVRRAEAAEEKVARLEAELAEARAEIERLRKETFRREVITPPGAVIEASVIHVPESIGQEIARRLNHHEKGGKDGAD